MTTRGSSAPGDRGPATALSGAALRERLRVAAGNSVDLASYDPRETFGHEKQGSDAVLDARRADLESLQERLWASRGGSVLVVLQGMDTSGKDGAIRHVMTAFNPQGCTVVGFGVPTAEELSHDFLWRVHRHTPGRGAITIFNRSHYEDVLAVRVLALQPESVWRQRFDHINDFERLLADSGTTIVKCFLWISRDEQRERLQARIDEPDKRWKFKRGDLDARAKWDDYVAAYEEALARCSTDVAPWYVIPADRKWFRNVAIAEILTDVLGGLHLEYPPPEPGIEGLRIE